VLRRVLILHSNIYNALAERQRYTPRFTLRSAKREKPPFQDVREAPTALPGMGFHPGFCFLQKPFGSLDGWIPRLES